MEMMLRALLQVGMVQVDHHHFELASLCRHFIFEELCRQVKNEHPWLQVWYQPLNLCDGTQYWRQLFSDPHDNCKILIHGNRYLMRNKISNLDIRIPCVRRSRCIYSYVKFLARSVPLELQRYLNWAITTAHSVPDMHREADLFCLCHIKKQKQPP